MANMTREQRDEAAQVLQHVLDKWYAPKKWLFLKQCAAYETAIAALRGPVPDPETGLVPCGCGSPLKLIRGEFEDKPDVKCDCWVRCTNPKCDWEIWDCVTQKEIVFRANRAMGYRA